MHFYQMLSNVEFGRQTILAKRTAPRLLPRMHQTMTLQRLAIPEIFPAFRTWKWPIVDVRQQMAPTGRPREKSLKFFIQIFWKSQKEGSMKSPEPLKLIIFFY